jgi:hypothetical protein
MTKDRVRDYFGTLTYQLDYWKRTRRGSGEQRRGSGGAEGMTRVGVGVAHGMSDAVLPRSDLRRGRIGLAVGNVGVVCRDTAAGRGGTEMSVD